MWRKKDLETGLFDFKTCSFLFLSADNKLIQDPVKL